MSGWLVVASADHVRRGVGLGVAQVNHGQRGGLARMHPGDTVVYYSSTEHMGDKAPLQHFTAIGTVTPDDIWQADEGDFKPFRRRVEYADIEPLPLADVKADLHLTGVPNWGYQLRRGLVLLDDHDVDLLRSRMAR
jgi:hypothetical protein